MEIDPKLLIVYRMCVCHILIGNMYINVNKNSCKYISNSIKTYFENICKYIFFAYGTESNFNLNSMIYS